MTQNDMDRHFRTLGLEPGASFEEVKEARNWYSKAFHPDRFPAGSKDAQRAAAKQLDINLAYEALKTWFEDPDRQAAQAAAKAYGAHTDKTATEWEQWQKEQAKRWEDELWHWEAKQTVADFEKKVVDEKEGRRRLVTRAKVTAVAILALLWIGRSCNADWTAKERREVANQIIDGTKYDLETRGASDSAYLQSDEQLKEKWEGKAIQQHDQWKQEDQDNTVGFVFLLLLSGGVGWAMFAPPVQKALEGWIEGSAAQ